jgi:hypothetical protein
MPPSRATVAKVARSLVSMASNYQMITIDINRYLQWSA